jgi:hypothetical protein
MALSSRQAVQRSAGGAIQRPAGAKVARTARVVPHGVKDVFMPALSSTMTEVRADRRRARGRSPPSTSHWAREQR